MSVTALQLFNKARALIDEYTEDGTVILDADIADIKARALLFIDMAQKELYQLGEFFKDYEISCTSPENLLGSLSNFNLEEYTGTAQYYPSEDGVDGAKAYYIEVDGAATVTIEENQAGVWTALETLSIDVDEWTAYSGLISATGSVRIKISGDYYCKHRNRCLYSYPFQSDKIPAYKQYYPVTMPSDFKSLVEVIREDASIPYGNVSAFKWEGKKSLMVYYGYVGTLRVVYRPIPATIDDWSDVLEIDSLTAEAIPYYVASLISMHEQISLVDEFKQKYNTLKYELSMPAPAEETVVIDEYGGI